MEIPPRARVRPGKTRFRPLGIVRVISVQPFAYSIPHDPLFVWCIQDGFIGGIKKKQAQRPGCIFLYIQIDIIGLLNCHRDNLYYRMASNFKLLK